MTFATTVDQYVDQQRRVYVSEALTYLVETGDLEGVRLHMQACLALQARVAGIHLGDS